jgi:hypothetical protein
VHGAANIDKVEEYMTESVPRVSAKQAKICIAKDIHRTI